ncbi:hypothetical protein PPACK8108_LOCUS1561 [Phakopsora pachyrhizi]|uniref:Association with the SNF1 complex (ASC) domain-containing protein n=1 Tax=Phakopsora pachyrhizi TaxID=170000 RepID=A0AAV0AIG4_PHAPC|nr:hypothetical protein PPACK8108_LOCUS1561 [Phakopsora pachyrhizi]
MGNQPSNEQRQQTNNSHRNFNRSNNSSSSRNHQHQHYQTSSSPATVSLSQSLNNSNNRQQSPRLIRTNHNQQPQQLLQHPSSSSSSSSSSSVAVRSSRRSLQLPDLQPLASSKSSSPTSDTRCTNQRRLKTTAGRPIRGSSINLISTSSSSSFSQSSSSSSALAATALTSVLVHHHLDQSIESQLRLANRNWPENSQLDYQTIPGMASMTVDPGVPPDRNQNVPEEEEEEENEDDRPGRTLAATPSLLLPDPDLPNLSNMPAIFPPVGITSPILSLPPLQQPVETVVPPPPPAIAQPFPPPLPQLDSIDLQPQTPVSNSSDPSLSTKVTETIAAATAAVQAAPALDIGAGSEGVPTLLTWKEPADEVYVTGTFSEWRQQIKLRKPVVPKDSSNNQEGFSALVALPPGPHQLKFIVDKRWKTSKYLPSATDNKGNLINFLQVNPGDQPFRGLGPRGIWSGYTYGGLSNQLGAALLNEDDEANESEEDWTTEIPKALVDYEEFYDRSDNEEETQSNPGEAGFAAEPPKLPAQLKEGILNITSRIPEGTVDDNSLLTRPDHSVLNHLAASPIKQGLLSVGVTSRYKRKYLTTVYYKPVNL